MPKKINAKIKKYINSISHMLPTTYSSKHQLLNELEQTIQDYLEEHPNASWQDILEEFGSASEVAGTIFANLPETAKFPSIKKQKRIHATLIITGIIIIIIVLFLLIYPYYYNTLGTYHVDYRINSTHYISDGTEVSSEIYEKNYIY